MRTLSGRSVPGRGLFDQLRDSGIIAGLFFAAALASLALSQQAGVIAAVWLPNAIAIVGLARIPRARWALPLVAVAIANLLANLTFGYPLQRGLLFLPPNLIEIVIGALLLHRLSPQLEFFAAIR